MANKKFVKNYRVVREKYQKRKRKPSGVERAEQREAQGDATKPGRMLVKRASRDDYDLEGLFSGPAFLILGGPSLQHTPLELLDRRGVFTCCVNNSWTVVRPQMWVSVDPPQKFHDVGWRDPAIMKFVPISHIGKRRSKMGKKMGIRTQKEDGSIVRTSKWPFEMPNVWFFPRNLKFDPEVFLTQRTVNWGSAESINDALGLKGGRSVMLAAIRLLYWLGFREINLVGCDFKMEEGRQNYGFDQQTGHATIKGNTRSYQKLQKRFKALKPVFDSAGLRVFNCNPASELKVFPMRCFKAAVRAATKSFPQGDDIRSDSWYNTKKLPKVPPPGEDPNGPDDRRNPT